jgi:hypothetical protein
MDLFLFSIIASPRPDECTRKPNLSGYATNREVDWQEKTSVSNSLKFTFLVDVSAWAQQSAWRGQ